MSNDEWVVTMPKLGETVTEGELTNWFKQVGDAVAFDDPLFEVSTDKVDSEIPSPYDGVIAEILVASGETVPVGTPLVRIAPPGGAAAGASGSSENRLPSTSHKLAAAGGPALGDPAAPQMGGSEGPSDEDVHLSAPTGVVHDITMPKLGETVTEGTIGSWLKQAGDTVEFDDPLFEVSTDKVDSEIPSPYDGVLLEILVQAGRDRPGRHPAGQDRRGRRSRAGRRRTVGCHPGCGLRAGARLSRLGERLGNGSRRPPGPAGCCCPRWSAGWSRRTGWTSARSTAPASAAGSAGRTSNRPSRPAARVRCGPGRAHHGTGRTGRRTAPVAAPHRRDCADRRSRSRPAPTTRATRSSRCPGCGSRWPAE